MKKCAACQKMRARLRPWDGAQACPAPRLLPYGLILFAMASGKLVKGLNMSGVW